MNAVAVEAVSHETFGGLVKDGETPEDALRRLEKRKDYSKVIGSDDGQRLLEAATAQSKNGIPPAKRRAKAPGSPVNVVRVPNAAALEGLLDGDPAVHPTERLLANAEARGYGVRRADPGEAEPEPRAVTLVDLPLELIDVGENVRADAGDLEELAANIAELGVLQPIRAIGPDTQGRYRAVWGQRRILASRIAKKTTIPALVQASADADDAGARRSIEQLAENLQRKDLNPIEEAKALRDVLTSTGLTHAALADKLGRSRPWVSNVLGLLEAAEPVQELVQQGQLSPSHVNALRGLAPKTAASLAKAAAKEGVTSHGLEQMVQQHKRDEQWRKDREAESARAIEERRAAVENSLATLEKKKVAKDAPIRVVSYYGNTVAATITLIEKAGYTNVKEVSHSGISSKPKGVPCDCDVWKVEANWNGALTIVPGCTKDAHLRQKTSNDEAVRRAKYAVQGSVIEKLAELAPTQVQTTAPTEAARIHITPLFARMALWHLLSWQVGDWSEKLGGKRNSPWKTIEGLTEEQLADELAKAAAKAFRDQHGYHIGWEAIAEELGIDVDAKPEEADEDLRPTGEVNADALRGEADRSIVDDEPAEVAAG